MPIFKIDIDQETYEWLVKRAFREKRNIPCQAEVELRRAAGLPFPVDEDAPRKEAPR